MTTSRVRDVKPVADAYADAFMDRPCPHCWAGLNEFCRHPDGFVRKVPCLARMSRNPENGVQ